MPRNNRRHRSEFMTESQPNQDDVMTSMMSPATKHLLADMNRSRVVASSKNNTNGHSSKHNDLETASDTSTSNNSRRPLATIQDGTSDNDNRRATDSMTSITAADSNQRTTPIKSNRTIGPHEAKYNQYYDAYVTQQISRYESKLQSNIGKQNSSSALPSYKRMNEQERSDAMKTVDDLLERLMLENDKGVEVTLESSRFVNSNDEHRNKANDQSFGSATTMGDHQANNHNNTMNKSIGSATTMMEQSMSLLGSTSNNTTINTRKSIMDASTTMEQSMSLLGGESTTTSAHPRASLESDATTAYDQSMSLLGNDSHLFSPSGDGNYNDDDEDDDNESRFSRGGDFAAAAAPIEKVRRYQADHSKNDDRMMTSPQFTSSYNHKRCASNSGKRGLKSRLRYQDDDNNDGRGDFTVDDSLLQHFDHSSNNEIAGGGDGFFPSQEDEFSPIQHRFSHDGIDRYDDGDDDASRDSDEGGFLHGKNSDNLLTQDGGGFDEDVSFGCNDGGFDDDDDDDNDFGTNSKWTQPSQPLTQQQNHQQSQWSTFKTVDPSTQTNEDDSPVKRRAIRFESTKKGYSKQREQAACEDDDEKIQSMRDQLTDMAVRDDQAADTGDDPIETVRNQCRRARSCHAEGIDTSLLDEVAPIDVRLRAGHLFHKDPLHCRQIQKKKLSSKAKSRGTKTVRIAKGSYNDRHAASDSEESLSDLDPSFTDPVSSFPSRVAERLNGAFDFMMKNDGSVTAKVYAKDECDDQNAGLLLSLDLKQTMAVTSKLLLSTKKLARSHQKSTNSKITSTPSAVTSARKSGNYLAGGTLIILRAKEDIPTWEAALREHTSLSVFSHNALQAKQRKSACAAAKCAGYDVVLTTYDLLKSKEAIIPLDSLGKAILNSDSNNNEDGWLNTRGSGTQSGCEPKKVCRELSILHRMSWYRVMMMDSLGRKGYLTKLDTSRAQAAIAVNSLSRFIFFVKEGNDYLMENKFKGDRKQIKSILQALHLPSGTTAKTFLGRWSHDVKSNTNTKESSLDSSSSDDRSMTDEYGSDNY